MAAYAQDLRDRALKALERGERVRSIAERLEVSTRWVYNVKARYERDGERTAARVGGCRRSRIADLKLEIMAWIKQRADMTLTEISERLLSEHAITIKTTALWHQLNNWGLSLKKNPARQRARAQGRTGTARRVGEKPEGA